MISWKFWLVWAVCMAIIGAMRVFLEPEKWRTS